MSAAARSVRAIATTADAAAATALTAAAGYLGVLTISAWRAHRDCRPAGKARSAALASPTHRFVILVPAHDEERLIGATLDALGALDYPAELFAVHVAADNCADATVAITRAHGVEAHERFAPDDGGKGPALHWLLHRLHARGDAFDAVVIVDADTIADPGFLRAVDAELAAGATVVQGYYGVRDADRTPTTAFRAAALAARHYLRPLGRTALGGSAGLYGNGMVFARDVLFDHPWSNHLTEDHELQLELLLDGIVVAFAPDASIEAEMPTTTEAALTQQQRWERGRSDLAARYLPGLVRDALRPGSTRRFAKLDAAADVVLPPFSVLALATAAWTGTAALRAVVGSPAGRRRGRRRLVLGAALLLTLKVHVLVALRMVGAPASLYRALLRAPTLLVWKAKLWFRAVRPGHDITWVRTTRNAEVTDDRALAVAEAG